MKTVLLSACAISLFAVAAAAQAPEPKVPGDEQVTPKLDPKACRDRARLHRGDTIENEGRAPRTDEPLSDQLSRTGGVICPPPDIDPDIRAPAPAQNSDMPVIPPPGTPGGEPAPRPK